MYNNILLLVLLIALFSTIKINDNTAFYIIVPTIEIATTNVALAAFLPAVLVKLHILYTSSHSHGSTNTATSSKVVHAKSSEGTEMDIVDNEENL